MNRQIAPGGIEWTRVWGRPGFTSNVVRGCQHQCRWKMPDGTIAICYAEEVARLIARKHYPKGFEHISYHENEFLAMAGYKKPAGIFIDSQSDLFGLSVESKIISQMIHFVREHPRHIFFSLTKNPARLKEFATAHHLPWPKNLWVGISSPPSYMFGKELTLLQQTKMLEHWLQDLEKCPAVYRWISIEPLAFDVAPILKNFPGLLDWAVLGAASRGGIYFQPDENYFTRALAVLDEKNIPVFFKGNLSIEMAIRLAGKWRVEFPDENNYNSR